MTRTVFTDDDCFDVTTCDCCGEEIDSESGAFEADGVDLNLCAGCDAVTDAIVICSSNLGAKIQEAV